MNDTITRHPTKAGQDDAGSSTDVDVLVVGGSLVGLAMAAFLGHHGIRSLVVERRPDLWVHPRAWGYNPRTMEMLTELGLLDEIVASGPDVAECRDVIKVDNLSGEVLERYEPDHLRMSHRSFAELSPAPYSLCAQHRLEPILYRKAIELGAEIRHGVQAEKFIDDGEGVVVDTVDDDGRTARIRARYLVAADGHKGTVRDQLGIRKPGMSGFANIMNVLFAADLSAQIRNLEFVLCHVGTPEGGVINTVDEIRGTPDDHWQLHIPYDPASESPADFTEERMAADIKAAAGSDDVTPHIIQALPWEVSGLNAESYRRGRVFLVGDAAHVMPPAGAFGANTGIHDAHNLAWKLAAVLGGWAGTELLDTYDIERRPVAGFTVEQALLRAAHQFMGVDKFADQIVDDRVIIFGYRYRSAAVPGGEPADEFAQPYAGTVPDGLPGTRLPHIRVSAPDRSVSTLDLVSSGLLVLTGPEGEGWMRAARRTGERLGVPVTAYRISSKGELVDGALQDLDKRFSSATGVGNGGMLLVRPDGIVAWRTADSPGDDAQSRLRETIRALLAR